MNRTGILPFLTAVTAFGVTMATSPQASATPPVIYSYDPIQASSACATSLSTWKNGDAWITGCGSTGDNTVYELVRSISQPEQFVARNFKAKMVAVDPASNTATTPLVWALTSAGTIYELLGNVGWIKYVSQPACSRALAVGFNKEVWVIECNNTVAFLGSGGGFIQGGTGPETLTKVAVPLNGGNPWFVAQSGNIYSYTSGAFHKQLGCATSIAIGGDGVPWITACTPNANGNVYRWDSSTSTFVQVLWNQQFNFRSISVSYDNIPWGIGDGTTYVAGQLIERTAELDLKNRYVAAERSNWSWLAAPSTIDNYFRSNTVTPTSQCQLANEVAFPSNPNCCNIFCNSTNDGKNVFPHLGNYLIRAIPNFIESWEGLISNLSYNSPVEVQYTVNNVTHEEVAHGTSVFQGVQYVQSWNPLPVGVGALELLTYPQFSSQGGFTSWTVDSIALRTQ